MERYRLLTRNVGTASEFGMMTQPSSNLRSITSGTMYPGDGPGENAPAGLGLS
jgi:hypothetical protein